MSSNQITTMVYRIKKSSISLTTNDLTDGLKQKCGATVRLLSGADTNLSNPIVLVQIPPQIGHRD
jgi:hypothetical protein